MENDKLIRNYKRISMNKMLGLLQKSSEKYLVREGSECSELIFDGFHNIYASGRNNFPSKLICLFNMVKKNVKKYLEVNGDVVLPEKKDTSVFNYYYDHDKGKITATDLNHAYWRIAYVKGYISEKTYEKGLPDEGKAVRLASLSTLGREKKYNVYEGNKQIDCVILQDKDENLRKVYDDIRLSCFYMMYELSVLLGDEFDCYKTDCIYYRDTPENRKLVHDYFNFKGMLFKQLVYEDEEEIENQNY